MDIAALGFKIDSKDARQGKTDLDHLTESSVRADKAADKLTTSFAKLATKVIASYAAWRILEATFKKFISATSEQQKVVAQLEATIRSTSGAAGLAAKELQNMAAELQRVTTYGDEAVIATESLLLTFTQIGRDTFPRALEATLDVATAMGTDLKSAAVQVGKALNDPILGVTALARSGIQFTESQKDMIKSLVDTGKTAEAQRLILKELETQFGGSARAARNTLGGALDALGNAWGDLFEVSGNATDGLVDSVNDLIDVISSSEFKSAMAGFGEGLIGATAAALTAFVKFSNAVYAFFDWANSQRSDEQLKSLAEQSVGNKLSRGEMSDPSGVNDAVFGSIKRGGGGGGSGGGGIGGGGIDKATKSYLKLVTATNQHIESLNIEVAAIGMTEAAATRLRAEQELLAKAANDNIDLNALATDGERTRAEELHALAEGISIVELALAGANAELENQSPWDTAAQNIANLNEMLAAGALSWDGYASAVGRVAEDMVGKYASAATGIIGQGEKLTNALGLQGKEQFEAQKAFSIANAIVSGGEAVVKSYNWGTTLGGPVGGAIAAGLAAAATAAQIASIASTSYTSKSAPSAAASGGAASAAAPAAPSRTVNVHLNGSSNYSGEQIAELLHEYAADGGSKINVIKAA